MDPEIVHEYGEILNLEKIGEIEQLVLDWEKDPQSETLRSFFRELHTIKGTARFIKAGLSEKLIHRMEELVSNLIRASDLLKQEELSVYADCFLKGLDQIVRIKAHVLENKQERSFWSDQHKQDSLKSYLQALDETIQLSQKLLEKIDMNTFNDRF
jgi:chemotaxis protein histidine kinase CheA